MEKFNTIKAVILTIIGTIGSIITNWFGGWTEDLTTLIIFMSIDYLMGLSIAAFWKKSGKSKSGALNSISAWQGLIRKGCSLLVVLVGYRLDLAIGTEYIKTAVIIAFIANEAISIVENIGIMGIPLPSAITKAIDVLKSKSEGE